MNATSLHTPTIGFDLAGLVGHASSMTNGAQGHELYFPSLFHDGRGLAFPCDARGQVDLDALPYRARINYLSARAMIGRDFGLPQVQAYSRSTSR